VIHRLYIRPMSRAEECFKLIARAHTRVGQSLTPGTREVECTSISLTPGPEMLVYPSKQRMFALHKGSQMVFTMLSGRHCRAVSSKFTDASRNILPQSSESKST
jgi:hypothetical protein